MQVNYDKLMRVKKYLRKINRTPLKEIEWMRDNGDKITYDDRLNEAWRFIGLSNDYFAIEILSDVIKGKEADLLEEFSNLIEETEKQKDEC